MTAITTTTTTTTIQLSLGSVNPDSFYLSGTGSPSWS